MPKNNLTKIFEVVYFNLPINYSYTMKKFVNFLKENWGDILVISMLVASFVLYFLSMSELLFTQHLFFWVTALLSGKNILSLCQRLCKKSRAVVAWLTTGIYFLALSIIWYLPISPYWGLIPILITGWIHCALMDMDNGWIISPLFSIMVGFSLMCNFDIVEKEDFLTSTAPETVVITYVDKISKDDIRVFIEGKGILLFEDNIKTKDSWRLNNGDTVQIWVYKGKIAKLIY